jgi:hypothetical protein
MNTLVKVGVAGALALGYVSAHAGAVIPSSSNPGDVFLFADVVNSSGSVISAFGADTAITVNGATGVSGNLTNGQTLYGATTNLSSLIALSQQSGNKLQWAVMGGGGQAGTNVLNFVTTDTQPTLASLTGRSGVNVGNWVTGLQITANNLNNLTGGPTGGGIGGNPDVLATSAAGAGGWDPTIIGNNAANWYSNGPFNEVTGLGTSAALYNVTSPGSTSVDLVGHSVLGNVTLTANGLVFSSTVSAVPLPAAIWLLGSGLLGLFGIGRRKAIAA